MARPRARRVRVGAMALVACTALGAVPGPAAAAWGGKVEQDDACTLLAPRQIRTFGKPVVRDQVSAFGPYDCNYFVGADPRQTPGGIFTAVIEYPVFGQVFVDARAAIEDQHAIAALSDHRLADVPELGLNAYLDRTTGSITVAVTKDFAFTLTWRMAGVETALDGATQKKLTKLARDVVSRVRR